MMTTGKQKFKAVCKDLGHKSVCKTLGVSSSIITQWLNGSRDPQGMKMSTAQKIKYYYQIGYDEWFEEVKPSV